MIYLVYEVVFVGGVLFWISAACDTHLDLM